MTRADASDAAERLNAEHPDRETHTWLARETAEGAWEVVKVRVPGGARRDPLKATTEAKPKPAQSDDAPPWRSAGDVPPFAAGG
jgi:hypothetical protein